MGIQNQLKGVDKMNLITEKEAAEYVGLPEAFLKRSRCQELIDVYSEHPSDVYNPDACVWYDKDELEKCIHGDSE